MDDDGQKRKAKDQDQIDWNRISRVLIVRLRSIGDTVLATPSLIALKRFLPDAQIDILLEDWVAPVLDGFDSVDNVLTVGKSFSDRLRTALETRRQKYDVVFNLHGGPTSTFLTYATGARHRVGYAEYRYSFLYTDLLSSSSDFWGREQTHSAEQQLALLGHVGVPFEPAPFSKLCIDPASERSLASKLADLEFNADERFAVIHPLAAFDSKRWAPEKFAEVIDVLAKRGVKSIAVGSTQEKAELESLKSMCIVPFWVSGEINLPETTALLAKASLFVGNDSGIAHMAAAMKVPSVVIFGSMNRNHWYPWTDAPNEMVFENLPCQPCPGYECKVYGDPKCIISIQPENVIAAIDRVQMKKGGHFCPP